MRSKVCFMACPGFMMQLQFWAIFSNKRILQNKERAAISLKFDPHCQVIAALFFIDSVSFVLFGDIAQFCGLDFNLP